MSTRTILLTAAWFAIAVAWIAAVVLRRESEGWEWPLRLAFGILLLSLGLITVFARRDSPVQRLGDWLTAAVMAVLTLYLAALTASALVGGNLGSALILGVFAFGLGSALTGMVRSRWRDRRRLETLATWCQQAHQRGEPWAADDDGTFAAYSPPRAVTADEVYGLDTAALKAVDDAELATLEGIGSAELAVIRRFLEVFRLPGVGTDVARQVHQRGLVTRAQLAALSEEEWQQFKGIGPRRASTIRAFLGT